MTKRPAPMDGKDATDEPADKKLRQPVTPDLPTMQEIWKNTDAWTQYAANLRLLLEKAEKKKYAVGKLQSTFDSVVTTKFPNKKFDPEHAQFISYWAATYEGDGVTISRRWAEKCYLGDRDTFYDTRVTVDGKVIYDQRNE